MAAFMSITISCKDDDDDKGCWTSAGSKKLDDRKNIAMTLPWADLGWKPKSSIAPRHATRHKLRPNHSRYACDS